MCAVLGPAANPSGIFYLDSAEQDAFDGRVRGGDKDELLRAIRQKADNVGLTAKLEDLTRHMRERGPLIGIFDDA